MPFWRWLYFSSSDFECQELIKQRFWQRLWSVYIRWNQRDFHQFSWNPAFSNVIFINEFNLFTPTADFLFLTLKSWFYSCIHPANIADLHFHSLWQAPTPQRQKIPYYCFYSSKISSMTCDWSDAHFSLVRKTIWPIRICAAHYKSIFFSNLAWSKSQYVYYKRTCIHTHFKNFGLSKTLPFSKYKTKIRSPWLILWDTTTICV